MTTSARAGTSHAYREAEATRLLMGHVVDPLRSSGILQESEHCVLLNGADDEGAALQPGVGAGAVWSYGIWYCRAPSLPLDTAENLRGLILLCPLIPSRYSCIVSF